jgi:hypothetical protein
MWTKQALSASKHRRQRLTQWHCFDPAASRLSIVVSFRQRLAINCVSFQLSSKQWLSLAGAMSRGPAI